MDPARAHLMELREKRKLEAGLRKPAWSRRHMQNILNGLLTALHGVIGARSAEQ